MYGIILDYERDKLHSCTVLDLKAFQNNSKLFSSNKNAFTEAGRSRLLGG